VTTSAENNNGPKHTQNTLSNMSPSLHSDLEALFDTLSTQPPIQHCPACGFAMSHLDATFSSQQGKSWTVALPVCLKCKGLSGPSTA
jgi:hypothetical protein